MEKKGATPQDVERCHKALDETLVQAQKMSTLAPENKWTLDGTKEGVTVHSTYNAAGLAMSRGEGIIDIPMEDLCDYIFDEKHLGDYDSSMEVNERLATIDDKCRIVWELTKKITFVSQRDFLYTCRWQEKDGSIYVIARSIDYPQKPVASGHVRAELKLVAWILTPVKDKPTSTHTIHIVCVDLCGSIPGAIVTRETLKQGYATIKIRETCAAWLKKRGPRKVEEKKPEPKVEEKKPEEPKAEEKKPEEPKVEEKKAEEPKAEEKKTEKVLVCEGDVCRYVDKEEAAGKKECCEKKTECTEKKECSEKKEECCEKKTECTEKKEECCEKKEDGAEKKECCEKKEECAEKKECCEEKGECADKKECCEEPKKE